MCFIPKQIADTVTQCRKLTDECALAVVLLRAKTQQSNEPADENVHAIMLPGHRSAFRAGLWLDCYRENM